MRDIKPDPNSDEPWPTLWRKADVLPGFSNGCKGVYHSFFFFFERDFTDLQFFEKRNLLLSHLLNMIEKSLLNLCIKWVLSNSKSKKVSLCRSVSLIDSKQNLSKSPSGLSEGWACTCVGVGVLMTAYGGSRRPAKVWMVKLSRLRTYKQDSHVESGWNSFCELN